MKKHLTWILAIILLIACFGCIAEVGHDRRGYDDRNRGGHDQPGHDDHRGAGEHH